MGISKQKVILFWVTGAGIGYFPRFRGTAATFVAIPFSLALNRLTDVSLPLASVILVLAVACAIRLATKGADILGLKEPQIIVIDEIVGFLIANFISAPNYWTLALAFILFRFFDVVKYFQSPNWRHSPEGPASYWTMLSPVYILLLSSTWAPGSACYDSKRRNSKHWR